MIRDDSSSVLEKYAMAIKYAGKNSIDDYNAFIEEKASKASEEEKNNASSFMKNTAKDFNEISGKEKEAAGGEELNEYQKFVSDEIGKELKSPEDFAKIPDLMKDVAKKWNEKSGSIESKLKSGAVLVIEEVKEARRAGLIKRASKTEGLYQDAKTQDFWKIDKESGKLHRLVGDNEVVTG